MYFKEERDYLEGLSTILREPDIESLQLHLQELVDITVKAGEANELEFLRRMKAKPEELIHLGDKLRKGASLSRDMLRVFYDH